MDNTILNKRVKGVALGVLFLSSVLLAGEELMIGFEDVPLEGASVQSYAGPGGGIYYNGSDLAGGFTSEGLFFETSFTDWGGGFTSWGGWAYSTTTDVETAGYLNQYSAFAGQAAEGQVYAVAYAPTRLVLPVGWKAPQRVWLTNTSYAGLSMRLGDEFSKKFGDDTSTEGVVETDFPDYLKLILTGKGMGGEILGSVEVFLADYRGAAEADFILEEWQQVDLSPLGTGVFEIALSLESTDMGDFGMNTPSYVAIDGLELGTTPSWAGYDLTDNGWANTESFLGWVYPDGDYVFVFSLGKYVYLPEAQASAEAGSWVFIPQ